MHIKGDTEKQKKQEKKIFLQKNTKKISDHHLEVNPVLINLYIKQKNLNNRVISIMISLNIIIK